MRRTHAAALWLTAPLLLACEVTPDPTDDAGPEISVFGPGSNLIWLSSDPDADVSPRGCPAGKTLMQSVAWWAYGPEPISYIHSPNGGTAKFGVSAVDPSGIANIRIVMPYGTTEEPRTNVMEEQLPLAHGGSGTFNVYDETMTTPLSPKLVVIEHTPQFTLGGSRSYTITATDMVGNRSRFTAIIADEADFCE